MCHGCDHPPGGTAEQWRIGVRRDGQPDPLNSSAIARIEKAFRLRRGFGAEEPIELLQLGALALPANPALLALAPRAPTVEEKKTARSVAAIQFLDPASDDVDILRVLGHVLPWRVGKIGQERES